MRRAVVPIVLIVLMAIAMPTACADDAPMVIDHGPTGEGVITDPIVTVTFSESMDPSTVRIDIPGVTGMVESRNPSFNLEMDDDLDPDTTYQVTVQGSSNDGVAMEPYTWSFTTAAASSTLRGRVVDPSGAPIQGASLSVDDAHVGETSSDGTFELTLSLGTHELVVTHAGDERTFDVDLSAGEVRDIGTVVLGRSSSEGDDTLLYAGAIVAGLLAAGVLGSMVVRRRRQP